MARHPYLALEQLEALGTTSWHTTLHGVLADKLLEIISVNPQIDSAQLISQLTSQLPSAARILVASDDASDLSAYASYLAEELSIGDLEEAIADYRARLADPSIASTEEYDTVFKSVTNLQHTLADKRAAHKARRF